jgi:hypothetical protein
MKVSNVSCQNRLSTPDDNETIYTDMPDLKESVSDMMEVTIYKRLKEDCPFARGNWMCDIVYSSNERYCIKLPLSMNEDDVVQYFKPLIDDLNSKDNK